MATCADSDPDQPPPPPPRRHSIPRPPPPRRHSNPCPPLPCRLSDPHLHSNPFKPLPPLPVMVKRLPLPPVPTSRPPIPPSRLPLERHLTSPALLEHPPPLPPRLAHSPALPDLPPAPHSPTPVIENLQYGGYDYKFDEEVPEDFLCSSICTKVLRDPQLSECCGQHFCQSCLKYWFAKHQKESCPHCREELFKYMEDKPLKRKINELKIHCTKFEAGCDWVGELNSLTNHLESDGCGYTEISCTNECGEELKRKDLATHLAQHCPLREYVCRYCETEGTYQVITGEHLSECDNFPLACPNNCGAGEIPRAEIGQHRSKCPLEPVWCPFNDIGCGVSLVQKDLESHMATNTQQHLLMVTNAFQSLKKQYEQEIKTIKSQSEQRLQAVLKQSEEHSQAVQKQSEQQIQAIREHKHDIQKSQEEIQLLRKQNENLGKESNMMKRNISIFVDCLLETCTPNQVASLQLVKVPHHLNKPGDKLEFTITSLSHYSESKEDWYSPFFCYKEYVLQLVASIAYVYGLSDDTFSISFSVHMEEEPLIQVPSEYCMNVGIKNAIVRVPIKKAVIETEECHSVSGDSLSLTVAF